MLRPCPACRRHVRVGHVCPFCASRAGLAALAVVASGCAPAASEPGGGGTSGGETRVESPDAEPSTTDPGTTTTERGPDDLGLVAAYGAPAPPPGPGTTPPRE